MPVNEIRQAQLPEAISCLENTILFQSVLSQIASAKDPISDAQFNEFLRYLPSSLIIAPREIVNLYSGSFLYRTLCE